MFEDEVEEISDDDLDDLLEEKEDKARWAGT
jgi:hypothetical protein